jgi:hypothetical protein
MVTVTPVPSGSPISIISTVTTGSTYYTNNTPSQTNQHKIPFEKQKEGKRNI